MTTATTDHLPAPLPVPGTSEPIGNAVLSTQQIRRQIDQLALSADVKARLASFARVSVRIGNKLVHVGKWILNVLFALMRRFPAVTFCLLFAVVVGAVLGAIPVIGAVLQPIALSVGSFLGVVIGSRYDLQNPDLSLRVAEFIEELRTVSA
jgi:hypothetical protein